MIRDIFSKYSATVCLALRTIAGDEVPASAPAFDAGVKGIVASVIAVNNGARAADGCCKEGDARPTDPFGITGLVAARSPGELVGDPGSGTWAALINVPLIGLCRGDLGLVGPKVVGGVEVRGDRSNLDLSTYSETVGRKSVGCSTA